MTEHLTQIAAVLNEQPAIVTMFGDPWVWAVWSRPSQAWDGWSRPSQAIGDFVRGAPPGSENDPKPTNSVDIYPNGHVVSCMMGRPELWFQWDIANLTPQEARDELAAAVQELGDEGSDPVPGE